MKRVSLNGKTIAFFFFFFACLNTHVCVIRDDAVAIANSVPLTDDGKLDSDASVWLLLG